jgi:hypothetical protein
MWHLKMADRVMSNTFVDNALCSCTEKETCVSCRFCMTRNTPDGRKALYEKITHFLVLQPFYNRPWFSGKLLREKTALAKPVLP